MRIVFVEPRRPCATSPYHGDAMAYHIIWCPPHLHSLAMRNNQRNLVMSCVTWQNKSISDSCRRALQNCMAEIKIKIYREKCKTCPTRCPRPCCPTPLPLPFCLCWATEAVAPNANYVKVFSRSRFICFLRRNFKGKLFDMWHYARMDPLGTVELANRPICIPNYGQGGTLALMLCLIETEKRLNCIPWSIETCWRENSLFIGIFYNYEIIDISIYSSISKSISGPAYIVLPP